MANYTKNTVNNIQNFISTQLSWYIWFTEVPSAGWNKHSHTGRVPSECLSASPPLLWAHLAHFGSHQCILSAALRPERSAPRGWRRDRRWRVTQEVKRESRHSTSCKAEFMSEESERSTRWLAGRTPIFLSFHSTVSCRSAISLTKPSCFKRSWRISWAAGKERQLKM